MATARTELEASKLSTLEASGFQRLHAEMESACGTVFRGEVGIVFKYHDGVPRFFEAQRTNNRQIIYWDTKPIASADPEPYVKAIEQFREELTMCRVKGYYGHVGLKFFFVDGAPKYYDITIIHSQHADTMTR